MTESSRYTDPLSRKRVSIRFFGLVLLTLVLVNGSVLLWSTGKIDQLIQQLDTIVHPPATSGFIKQTYTDATGVVTPYYVFVPHQRHARYPLPSIVYLNGLGENGVNWLSPLRNGLAEAIWEDEAEFPFLVVWVQCEENDQWSAESRSTLRSLAIMREAIQKWGGDSDRVAITGISAGGTGAWELAASYPDRFSAVVPISGTPNASRMKEIVTANMPVWMYYVADDSPAIGETCRQAQAGMLLAGLNPRLTEVPSHGKAKIDFHDAWSFAFRDPGLYRWIELQRLSTRHSAGGWTAISPETLIDRSQTTTNVSVAKSGIVHVDSVSNEPIPFSLQLPRTFDFEFEFLLPSTFNDLRIGLTPATNGSTSESGVWFDISPHDPCRSQFCWGQRSPILLNTAASFALHRTGWNHFRISISNGLLISELNGWTLFQDPRWDATQSAWLPGMAFTGMTPGGIELRNVRWREIPQPPSNRPQRPLDASQTSHRSDTFTEDDSYWKERIVRQWREREKQLAELSMSWVIEPHYQGYECGWYRRDPWAKPTMPEIGHTVHASPTSWRYSGPWPHRLLELSRKKGFFGEASLRDFATVQQSGFVPEIIPLRKRHWQVDIDQSHRRDFVHGEAGSGFFGMLFAGPENSIDRLGEAADARWRGAILSCRPWTFLSRFSLPTAWSVHSRPLALGLSNYLEVEVSIPDAAEWRWRCLLDPTRDCLVVRSCLMREDTLIEQIDIHYKPDAAKMWMPSGWSIASRPTRIDSIASPEYAGREWLFHSETIEKVLCKHSVLTTAKSLEEKSVDSLPFPEGTIIYDQTQKGYFRQSRSAIREPLTTAEVTALVNRYVFGVK